MRKAEREYLSKLIELGCILCRRLGYGPTPAEIHHLREGQGLSQRASHFDAIPLCAEHHRGDTGLHGMGRRAFEAHYGVTERSLKIAAENCNQNDASRNSCNSVANVGVS